jgi:hypothetical protein
MLKPGLFFLYFSSVMCGACSVWASAGRVVSQHLLDVRTLRVVEGQHGRIWIRWETDESKSGGQQAWLDFRGRPTNEMITPQEIPEGTVGDERGGRFDVFQATEAASNGLCARYTDAHQRPIWDSQGIPLSERGGLSQLEVFRYSTDHRLVVVWKDGGGSLAEEWYGQSLASSGQRLWSEQGVVLLENAMEGKNARAAISQAGIVYLAWQDTHASTPKILLQAWSPQGLPLWPSGGIAVHPKTESPQEDPHVIGLPRGVAVIWKEHRGEGWQWMIQSWEKSIKPLWEKEAELPLDNAEGNRIDGVSYSQRL